MAIAVRAVGGACSPARCSSHFADPDNACLTAPWPFGSRGRRPTRQGPCARVRTLGAIAFGPPSSRLMWHDTRDCPLANVQKANLSEACRDGCFEIGRCGDGGRHLAQSGWTLSAVLSAREPELKVHRKNDKRVSSCDSVANRGPAGECCLSAPFPPPRTVK